MKPTEMKQGRLKVLIAMVALGAGMSLASTAYANLYSLGTFETSTGATESSGLPVSASATFETDGNSLLITIQNMIVNPTGVAQNVSDLYFTLDSGATSGTLDSSMGNLVNVKEDGTTESAGSSVSTGWTLSYDSIMGFHLDGLGLADNVPAYTILGAPDGGGVYSAANGSIAGNSAHNPFIDQTASFALLITGVTSDTKVSDVVFSFGTTSGNTVSAPDSGSTVMLLGVSFLGLAFVRFRLRTA